MDRIQSPWPDPDDITHSEVDPDTGALHLHHPNGDVTIDFSGGKTDQDDGDDDADDPNIADYLDDATLADISSELCDGIEADEQSCSKWRSNLEFAMTLMALEVERAGSGGSSSGAVEGMSRVRHPLLQKAVLLSQATASAEMLPAGGPVKMSADDGDAYMGPSDDSDADADALEKDLNHYLTSVETSYGPDTERMLLYRATGGVGFKKVYNSPLRNRPVSENVDPQHMIISDGAANLETARRVTQEIRMTPSVLKRMQILGVYRDVDVAMPSEEAQNTVDRKVKSVEGSSKSGRTEDEDHVLWECYCELDIPGYEHEIKGKPSGLPMPWRVTIEKSSREILEIRSNVLKDDNASEDALPVAREVFVKFEYVPGYGFWPIGLCHILGNATQALTAAWRVLLDAGMFANFPGFFYLQTDARQMHNNFRIPPGGAIPIKPGAGPSDIRQLLMAAPYKDPSATFMGFIKEVESTSAAAGQAAEVQVGEGRADAPVGTTLAMIEQATKVEAAAHKRAHMAQAKEFQLLKRLFKEDPEALWRDNPKANITDKDKVLRALENADIVPRSDPNTPSHLHRVMKYMAMLQLAGTAPELYNKRELHSLALENAIELSSATINRVLLPPQPPMPPPQPPVDQAKLADLSLKAKQLQFNQQKMLQDSADKAADRKSKENLRVLELAGEAAVHPDGMVDAEQVLHQLAPFLQPASPQSPVPQLQPQPAMPPSPGLPPYPRTIQ